MVFDSLSRLPLSHEVCHWTRCDVAVFALVVDAGIGDLLGKGEAGDRRCERQAALLGVFVCLSWLRLVISIWLNMVNYG